MGNKKTGTINLFSDFPDVVDKEDFTCLLQEENVLIERIISQGQTSPEKGWYDQEKSEWVIVLEGKAILEFIDGQRVNLEKGDFLNIPAHKKHRVSWTDPEGKTIWLAVHYL
jgi:cupin 2 domain-containing protein